MIKDYSLEYGGPMPMYNANEVQTIFALATKGKVLQDYVTWADHSKGAFWDQERNRTEIGLVLMNELRINYIKKESKCCKGNRKHRVECRRDIQNVTPFRLSVSHSYKWHLSKAVFIGFSLA